MACAVLGCKRRCGTGKLMCLTHWRRVPERLHAPIYDGYNEYKGTGKLPRSYGVAVREARVLHQESRRIALPLERARPDVATFIAAALARASATMAADVSDDVARPGVSLGLRSEWHVAVTANYVGDQFAVGEPGRTP